MSIVGQAVIELAFYLGAVKIFSTGKPKDFNHLRKLGANPIHLDTAIPNSELENNVDVIVDCTCYDTLDYLLRIKKNGGRVIFHKYGDISKTGRHG